ncbi:MAG: chemotaxis protein CheR [Rhodocyclaceae bacterium]|nr:chemotaxis protein CheR [Rhodocyclaceae bacterium]
MRDIVDSPSKPAGAAAPVREFPFTQDDFVRVRNLIYEFAGISLSPVKKEMVYSRLVRRLRALGQGSFEKYLAYLEGNTDEIEAFVNALTTNLTAFFREPHHFEILGQQMQMASARPFRIWCAAASTGEEAYSLAMAACEAFDSMTPPVQILASDIDTHVLRTASEGVYPAERVDRLNAGRLKRFFLRGSGSKQGLVRVRPELQALLKFERINLLDSEWPIQTPFDAIFCRNVMIYFDKNTQLRLLQRFKPLLQPCGLFYAGHSESFLHAAELFRSCGRTVYEHAR